MSKRKSRNVLVDTKAKKSQRRYDDGVVSTSIHGLSTREVLTMLNMNEEDRKRPDASVSPRAVISWIQKVGEKMHGLLGERNSQYKSCVVKGETKRPLILTIPDPSSLYKHGTMGLYIPKILADAFSIEKFILRWVCILGIKIFYQRGKGTSIEMTHIGTIRVCKFTQCFKECNPEYMVDNTDVCCWVPWGLERQSLSLRDFPFCWIPWRLLFKLIPSYHIGEHEEAQETFQRDMTLTSFSNDGIYERNESDGVHACTRVIDGVEYTITRKDSLQLAHEKEKQHQQHFDPLILNNGWNIELEPPLDKTDTFWSLSDELKELSQKGQTPIFALDKSAENNKLFITTSYMSLWKIISGKHTIKNVTQRSHVCAHSVIRNHYACKGFWDFEVSEPHTGWPEPIETLKVKLVKSVLILLKHCFEEVLSVTLDNSDFLILEACKPTKISFHIILSSPGIFFTSFEHMKKFMRILECFIIRHLVDKNEPLREHAMKLFLLPKDQSVSHSIRPLDLVTLVHPESGKENRLACFWDMGASDGSTTFFRTPMATKFVEERPLKVSSMNEFEPDEDTFHTLVPSENISFEEMIFLSGMPTAVYKKYGDDRDINTLGMDVLESTMRQYAHDIIMNTSRDFFTSVNGVGENVRAKIDVKGLSDLLPSSRRPTNSSFHGSSYLNRQRREGINWTFESSANIKGLTGMIKNVILNIPELSEWTNAGSFDYCPLFGFMRGCKRGEKVLNGIMIKVMDSTWCPIKRGTHKGRRGNAKALIKRGIGNVVLSCFTSHCGKKEYKGMLRNKRELGELFRLLESIH